jgi:hypothetical protein
MTGAGSRPAPRNSALILLCVLGMVVSLGLAPPSHADEIISSCGPYPNLVFQPVSQYGLPAVANCPGGSIQLYSSSQGFTQGQNALWQATAPPGLLITDAWIPALQSAFVNDGSTGDYGGDFYWNGGSSNITPSETTAVFHGLNSTYFGMQLVSGKPTCNGPNYQASITVQGFVLIVQETAGPTLSASGLWQSTGWIRGRWSLAFSGDSPSGMCSLTASLADQPLPGSSASPVPYQWHQCAAAGVSDPVDTASDPQGPDTLQIGGTDAAGVPASSAKTVYVDNQPPSLSLTGPSAVPSSAVPQTVTATAAAGPSGVAGISCVVDNAPAQWFASSSAQVPVSGLGEHQVQCRAENNAVDASGERGSSPTEAFTMMIGTPTVTAITFSKLVDKLRCRRITERVKVRGRWHTIKRRGKRIRVYRRAHLVSRKVTKCHARTVRHRRTVWVTVRRHGKRVRVKRHRLVRVIVLPHVVNRATRHVAHGKSTTVNGWLGTTSGVALGGQTVEILAAPANGSTVFTPVATAITAANGGWTARIPAGPSRILEAIYNGGGDSLPSLSGTVSEIVPAKVVLVRVSPRKVAWGGTVKLVGQLKGGYLPPGGALVRLRIGEGSAVTTYGVREHVGGRGRFTTRYTFGAGDPATFRTFWFQVASLPMGSYPYAAANSRRVSVLVGGHPHRRRRRRS